MITNLYIDYSYLCYRTLFAVANDIKEVGYGILRHSVLKNLLYSINQHSPDKVFICCDSKLNWRKKLYADYKGQRAEAKEKQDVDWDQFYETINEISGGFQLNFPFHVLSVPYLEADDIIAHLVRKNCAEQENIIVTSDGDYKQLLHYPNTKLYCPTKKIFVKSDCPLNDLEVKVLMGDKSDNIPAIAPRVGVETAKKLVEGEAAYKDQTLAQMMENTEIKKNYDRNKKIIDLSKTPRDLLNLLDKQLEGYQLASTRGMFQYFIDNGMRDMVSKIEDITRSLSRLNPNYVKPVEKPEKVAGAFADFL